MFTIENRGFFQSKKRLVAPTMLEQADFNMVATIGAFGFGLSQLIFLTAIIKCIKGGPKATPEVWDNPIGLEWTLPSPAPFHTFETPPNVKFAPR